MSAPSSRAQPSILDGGYEPVIGLEIHVQLTATRTKMFCGCALAFGAPPNTLTCPVCLGLPGSLPVVNERAIDFGLRIGLALGCELAPRSIFHRKNYFYPDLPKGYQISQYDEPLCRGGQLGPVRIHRVHLEEDAAKLIHVGTSGRIHGSDVSVVDFNRGGTPLAEIVTEPDLRSAEQAREWLELLRETLRALGVSDVDMSQGSLRCDANVSVRPAGSTALGTKTELKNMNSFRFLAQGIDAEIRRQLALIEAGEAVGQETLHFDPATGALTPLRSKEEAHDYRYFPEPDLLPIAITPELLHQARAAVGAVRPLPAERLERYQRELGDELAGQLVYRDGGAYGAYFEQARPALAAQAVASDRFVRTITASGIERILAIPPAKAVQAMAMASAGEITSAGERTLLEALGADPDRDPRRLVQELGLAALADSDELAAVVAAAIAANPDAAEKIRAGNAKAIGPIVGFVMRETRGRADGAGVTRLVNQQLGVEPLRCSE